MELESVLGDSLKRFLPLCTAIQGLGHVKGVLRRYAKHFACVCERTSSYAALLSLVSDPLI